MGCRTQRDRVDIFYRLSTIQKRVKQTDNLFSAMSPKNRTKKSLSDFMPRLHSSPASWLLATPPQFTPPAIF